MTKNVHLAGASGYMEKQSVYENLIKGFYNKRRNLT
jgi:hypothetical protein